jgi:hypothetical protein
MQYRSAAVSCTILRRVSSASPPKVSLMNCWERGQTCGAMLQYPRSGAFVARACLGCSLDFGRHQEDGNSTPGFNSAGPDDGSNEWLGISTAQTLSGSARARLEQCTSGTVYRPETLRIHGELRIKQGNLQLAHADFRDSIAMARSMGSRVWELRQP